MRRPFLAIALIVALAACGGSAVPDLNADLEAGRATFGAHCALCHGGNGQGGSAPGLAEVLTTFGGCLDQIHWITVGSERHKTEVGPTYGDTDKPITAVMPGFESILSAEQIAQVAAFERTQFGGQDESAALEECGL